MERSKRRPDKGLWGPNRADSTEGQAPRPKVDPFGPQRAAVSLKGSGCISGVSNSRIWKMPGRSRPWHQGGGSVGRNEDMKTGRPVSAPPYDPQGLGHQGARSSGGRAGRCRPPSVGECAETKPGQPEARRWGRLGCPGRAARLGGWTGRIREGRTAGLTPSAEGVGLRATRMWWSPGRPVASSRDASSWPARWQRTSERL